MKTERDEAQKRKETAIKDIRALIIHLDSFQEYISNDPSVVQLLSKSPALSFIQEKRLRSVTTATTSTIKEKGEQTAEPIDTFNNKNFSNIVNQHYKQRTTS